jgi:cytolysin (calcineurin-like family phosphatase)
VRYTSTVKVAEHYGNDWVSASAVDGADRDAIAGDLGGQTPWHRNESRQAVRHTEHEGTAPLVVEDDMH